MRAAARFAAAALSADDWPMYLYDLKHSSFNPPRIEDRQEQCRRALDEVENEIVRHPAARARPWSMCDLVGDWDGFFTRIDARLAGRSGRLSWGWRRLLTIRFAKSAIGVTRKR